MQTEQSTSESSRTQVKEHGDDTWDKQDLTTIDAASFPYDHNKANRFFGDRIHDLSKSKVLEIGCGPGDVAIHLAKRGAEVTSIDISSQAVQTARKNAELNGVEEQISVQEMGALEIDSLSETYDFVVGRFVLHHIEPFQDFVEALDEITTPSANGLFLENSARNHVLMLFREYLTGRLGVPKYGDDYEYPLTPSEVNALRRNFDVTVHYPEMVFFKLMNTYLIGYENGREELVEAFKSLDDTLYRLLPALRKYSYLQVIELDK